MSPIGSTREFVLFINEYFNRFVGLLDGLTERGKPSIENEEFFSLYHIRMAGTSIELLRREANSSILDLLAIAERCVSFSFRSGEFDKRDLKLCIEKNQGDFYNPFSFESQNGN